MSSSSINPVLLDILAPLSPYYENPAVEEVAINRFKEIWLKKHNGVWEREDCEFLTQGYIKRMIQFVGNVNQVPFDIKKKPAIATTLPGGHRFQAIWGANVRYELDDTMGVAICIRRLNKQSTITIHDYIEEDLITDIAQKHPLTFPLDMSSGRLLVEDLINVIAKGKAVILSGATNTGKTTFLRDLVRYIPKDKRVVTIEDTREIWVPNENRVSLFISRTETANTMGYDELINCVLRLTPEVVIAGEVSQHNTAAIFRLLSTGHSSFITTIHSDSPIAAIHDFHKNLRTQGLNVAFEEVLHTFTRSIARIVQLGHRNGRRVITDVLHPASITAAKGDAFHQEPVTTLSPKKAAYA